MEKKIAFRIAIDAINASFCLFPLGENGDHTNINLYSKTSVITMQNVSRNCIVNKLSDA